jgi:ketosteroid isomerase-like protein
MPMETTEMLRAFCDAVARRNGAAFASLFTEDGVYHDVFYGAFEGREKIAAMIEDWFYRTATDFRWDMHEPISDLRALHLQLSFDVAGSQGRAGDVRRRRDHAAPRR